MSNDLEKTITRLWEAGDVWRDVMPESQAFTAVRSVIAGSTVVRCVAPKSAKTVTVNEWVKLAILMWFRVQEMQIIEAGPFEYVDCSPDTPCIGS